MLPLHYSVAPVASVSKLRAPGAFASKLPVSFQDCQLQAAILSGTLGLVLASRHGLSASGQTGLKWKRQSAARATKASSFLTMLHPSLVQAVEGAMADFEARLGRAADVMLIGPKEEIGGVQGMRAEIGATPERLRQMQAKSFDIVVEVRSEEILASGWEARQNRFYPLGGHAFSLANDFIINLASISKVLRDGGKFFFLTSAVDEAEVLPFAFLRLPHLSWEVDVRHDTKHEKVSTICCSVSSSSTAAEALKKTPSVVAEQCKAEISRQRYYEALRPHLKLLAAAEKTSPLKVLDWGCGDGGLMSWAYDPAMVAADGPLDVTLVESNPELAEKAAERLPQASVVHHEGDGAAWPFKDAEFDVVVLAFVLHHVLPSDRPQLLEEAKRTAKAVLVLEDQPQAAPSEAGRRLAWHVTEEHFRPFGQNPDDYLAGVLCDDEWRMLFLQSGLEVMSNEAVPGSLRHPVPHLLYCLKPAK